MLKPGEAVPDVQMTNQAGKQISFADYKGKKLALYFYPKDMTPGCTVQAKNLTSHLKELNDAGIEILGVSPDSEERHCRFIDKHDISFPLVADTGLELSKAFGVWGRKKFMGKEYDGIHRTTFLIDEEGIISHVIEKVKTKAHHQQIMDLV